MPDPADPPDRAEPAIPRPAPARSWRDLARDAFVVAGIGPGRVLAGVAAVAVAAAIGWWLLRPPAPPVEASVPLAGPAADVAAADPAGPAATTTTTPSPLVVHAAGAVQHPGVVEVAAGAHVADVVAAAGGLTADADGERLNLAAPVADGARVYVPRRGQQVVPPAEPAGPASTPAGSAPSPPGDRPADASPIDLNTATEAELDTLPGVGPATAGAIVAHRTAHGPYRSVEDLLDVRGIGDAKLAELRPLVTV